MADLLRGEIWWADLPEPRRSEPGYRRPVLVIQSDRFNRSQIQTALVAIITSNLRRAQSPGNVLIPSGASGLPRDSVVNVSQVHTLDQEDFLEWVGALPPALMARVNAGLRESMGL